jgi:hypothetical protein
MIWLQTVTSNSYWDKKEICNLYKEMEPSRNW